MFWDVQQQTFAPRAALAKGKLGKTQQDNREKSGPMATMAANADWWSTKDRY